MIAHTDASEVGKNYSDKPEWSLVQERIKDSGGKGFEMDTDNGRSTVFADKVVKDWIIVVVVRNELLYRNLRKQLLIGILLSAAIFIVILIFAAISAYKIDKAEQSEDQTMERVERMNTNITRSLAFAIDAKDRYTSGHSQRVADYAVMIAKRMGKSLEEQKVIYHAGLLHDVGKIRVPEDLINKPGRLTDKDMDSIRIHPVSGYDILLGIHDDPRISFGAKYHHERYDGKGYPNGLEGENIPEVARIIAVADAYDAMASDRSYRGALSQDTVREEILKGKGTQFDPAIADIMLQIIDEDKGYTLRQQPGMMHGILAVDDEEISLLQLKHILKDLKNVRVYTALNAAEALKILADTKIDLILVDQLMPDMDGFALLEEIRKNHDIPAIMMSGDKSGKTINRIRAMHIDDYVSKPLNPAITREAVYGILTRSARIGTNEPG